MTLHHSRREFLAASAALMVPRLLPAAQAPRRIKVAAIYTVLRLRSHAHNILESFLKPYLFRGQVVESGVDVVSLYADQRVPEGDENDDTARRYKIPMYKTIRDALTLGGKELAVDAVLSIGEHGDYPMNGLGVIEYPRKRFFDEIVAVMKQSNRFVPMFNDKHLSYRWDWAKEMADTCKANRIPFLAGSSVPLAQRNPDLELPIDCSIEEAVSVHGGPPEVYDFHAFEVLQSHIERRKGGETGIRSVEFLSGDALFQAAQQGRFSLDLARRALSQEFGDKIPDLRRPFPNEKPQEPHGVLLTYKDGLKATVLKLGQKSTRWQFACKLAGEREPRACSYYVGPWGNRNLFMGLSNAILDCFKTGRPGYPVERTLLASGMLEAAMRSKADQKPLQTPHLEFAYTTGDWSRLRENGASWKLLKPEDETSDLNPLGKYRP